MRSDGIDVERLPLTGYRLRIYEVKPIETGQCHTCRHLRGYVTWWCTNRAAIKRRRSSLPGVVQCPDWAAPPIDESALPKLPWWKVAA